MSYRSHFILAFPMPTKPKLSAALDARKKPGQRRAVATVEAILEAAAHILETGGLGAYSTNAVAARAGASIGSVYQYFPSKDAITRALINRHAASLLEELRAIDPGLSAEAALRRMLLAAVRHQLQRPGLARTLDLEELRLPMDEAYEAIGKQTMALFRTCLHDTGRVRPADLDVVSNDLAAIVKGLVDAAGQRRETNEAHLLARVERAVLGYLGNP